MSNKPTDKQLAARFSTENQPDKKRTPKVQLRTLLRLALNEKAEELGVFEDHPNAGDALLAKKLIDLAVEDEGPNSKPVLFNQRLSALREVFTRLYGLPTFEDNVPDEDAIANLRWIGGQISTDIANSLDAENIEVEDQ